MSLINGMDSIMSHIKNQEILIKKLTEENEKLKDENMELESTMKGALNSFMMAQNSYNKLKVENEKLKDENMELESTMKGAMDSFMMAQNSYNKLKVENDNRLDNKYKNNYNRVINEINKINNNFKCHPYYDKDLLSYNLCVDFINDKKNTDIGDILDGGIEFDVFNDPYYNYNDKRFYKYYNIFTYIHIISLANDNDYKF